MAGGKKVKNKITVIGSLNYDVILKVDRLPYKGETMAVDNRQMKLHIVRVEKAQIRQCRQLN